jgi:hypothetical protein
MLGHIWSADVYMAAGIYTMMQLLTYTNAKTYAKTLPVFLVAAANRPGCHTLLTNRPEGLRAGSMELRCMCVCFQ